jgi:hypothetical protein
MGFSPEHNIRIQLHICTFVGAFAAVPVDHTRGGTIVSCSVDFFILQDVEIYTALDLSQNQEQNCRI